MSIFEYSRFMFRTHVRMENYRSGKIENLFKEIQLLSTYM